ncbi:MAG: hypothetical protein JRN59_08335, partial [Nitrososphaerota archaeon]|nr:hypothetical protein [Nitrososphaerota archaeon]
MSRDTSEGASGLRPRMTTIAIAVYDRDRLDRLKLHRREPYGEVVSRLIDEAEKTGSVRGPQYL